MKKTKIGIALGYGSANLSVLAEAIRELDKQGYAFEVMGRVPEEEIDDDFCQWLKEEADVIVLYISSYYEKSYAKLSKIATSSKVPVFSMEYGERPLSG